MPPPKHFCTCRKYCSPTDKEMGVIAGVATPPRPALKARKRRLDEEVEDPPHISKRVAGSSSVCVTLLHGICALSERYSWKCVLSHVGWPTTLCPWRNRRPLCHSLCSWSLPIPQSLPPGVMPPTLCPSAVGPPRVSPCSSVPPYMRRCLMSR
jgi:hypothetical protein